MLRLINDGFYVLKKQLNSEKELKLGKVSVVKV